MGEVRDFWGFETRTQTGHKGTLQSLQLLSMSLSKNFVRQALSQVSGVRAGTSLVSGEHLLWVSACDTYASLRVQWEAGSSGQVLDRVGGAIRDALFAAAAQAQLRVDSLIIEFVDDAGTVLKTVRHGGIAQGAQGSVAAGGAQPKATAPVQPQGVGQGGAGGGGGGGSGHTPIPGLAASPNPQSKAQSLPGVKHIIAVGAGKGGVGKSSVAVNLAVGLARLGHSVGLLDADIYGPSMPTMLGLGGLDAIVREKQLEPFFVHGVKAMTIGKLVAPDQALIWRGPMAHGAFKQLTEQTNWGELDYLIIDLPPGTGDVALTMAQMLELSGAVVVCTPQRVAQDDATRAARMFKQLGIEVLGVVENMSHFVGDDGKVYDLFGRGGAEMMAQRLNLPFLGAIPITMSLRVNSDQGDPTANFTGKDLAGLALKASLDDVIRNTMSQLALAQMRTGNKRPTLSIS